MRFFELQLISVKATNGATELHSARVKAFQLVLALSGSVVSPQLIMGLLCFFYTPPLLVFVSDGVHRWLTFMTADTAVVWCERK